MPAPPHRVRVPCTLDMINHIINISTTTNSTMHNLMLATGVSLAYHLCLRSSEYVTRTVVPLDDSISSRQEVNLVVTQQIAGQSCCHFKDYLSVDVFVELSARVTLITSLSEFISVFKQPTSSVVFDPTTTPVTSSRLFLSYDHLQSFRIGYLSE